MSFDKSSGFSKSRTGTAAREVARQQLPSLNSLFGPAVARPAKSPQSERPLSHHSAHSPFDRPALVSGERTSTTSYFPPTTSPFLAQSRHSHELKYDGERQLAQTASSGISTYGYTDRSRSRSRSDVETVGRWSTYPESRGNEYTLGSEGSTAQSVQDQKFRLQFPGSKEAVPRYSEQRPSHNGHGPNPLTPISTAGSDGLSLKDGLGPKIWTGTHFLPRFVRAADVRGEGLCYFYDDGSHCKSVIDGEAVNAHWGVTKAGKPRKRLAIACVTCREKKIKCDPDYPRCVQCEKFGRVCKFKNA